MEKKKQPSFALEDLAEDTIEAYEAGDTWEEWIPPDEAEAAINAVPNEHDWKLV